MAYFAVIYLADFLKTYMIYFCVFQIPVSVDNPLYPQQTIAVGVHKTKPCSQVTEDTDDDDFNWDRLLQAVNSAFIVIVHDKGALHTRNVKLSLHC